MNQITLQLATTIEILKSSGLGWEMHSSESLRYRKPRDHEIDLGTFIDHRNELPSELITRFLGIEPGDNASLFKFLQETGIWNAHEDRYTFNYFWHFQATVRSIVTHQKLHERPDAALSELVDDLGAYAQFEVTQDSPMGIRLRIADTWSAIALGCWLEWAQGVKRRYCARPDCPTHGPGKAPFIPHRPDMRFCEKYCAQLEHLRASRAAARKVSKKLKPRRKHA